MANSSGDGFGGVRMFFFCSQKVKRDFDAAKQLASGDDVGRDLVFDEGDTVAQLKLALLQPLQPQQIGRGRLMQRINRGVEIAVFLLQPCELGLEFALIFVGHGLLNQNADEICENSGRPSAVDLTFASAVPRVLEERMPNPKPHLKQMFGSVPLVLTFVNEPTAIRYEFKTGTLTGNYPP